MLPKDKEDGDINASWRRMLLSQLTQLADPELQIEWWKKGNYSEDLVCGFWDTLEFFFDDTALATDPESILERGWLHNEREVIAIRKITQLLDGILVKYGKMRGDDFYITVPEWKNVVLAAREAKEIIKD